MNTPERTAVFFANSLDHMLIELTTLANAAHIIGAHNVAQGRPADDSELATDEFPKVSV